MNKVAPREGERDEVPCGGWVYCTSAQMVAENTAEIYSYIWASFRTRAGHETGKRRDVATTLHSMMRKLHEWGTSDWGRQVTRSRPADSAAQPQERQTARPAVASAHPDRYRRSGGAS
nr:hypothetical protein CFP56_04464 [Quercus suber]